MEIITKTPIYVWPLLMFLLFMGIRARKLSIVPLKMFIIMPSIFCTWAIYAILMRYGTNFLILSLWTISLLLGVGIGYLIVRGFSMRFDKMKKKVEVPGSWMILTLSMTIFCLRYFLGITTAIRPDLAQSWLFLVPELLATMVTGIFAGRSICCFQKYWNALHVPLE